MEKLCNTNKISIILAISSVLFFLHSFDNSSYSINNENNQIKDEEFDYIFDPGEYIASENKEEQIEDDNTNKLNNQNNLPEQVNDPTKVINTKEAINLVNKSNIEKDTSQTYMDENNDISEDSNKDKVVVKTRINLANLEKKGFLSMAAFINGQEVLKNVSLDEIDPSKQTLNINLVVDKETDIVNAGDRDEFFVCAYHIKDLVKEYNTLTYFDCDEGDLLGPGKPTISRLFSTNSLVYSESQNIFNNSSNKYSQLLSTNNNNNDNPNQQQILDTEQENEEKVKIKIYAPLEDRKNTQKLKIAAMVKGQIKSAIIDDVQKEFDKNGGYTIERTFTFDRDTNIGKIQIGDRFHACVSGNDLNPPEGTECEKRTVKNIGRENVLYAR
ncbi:MAG: hypothetical protein ACRD6U_09840 [Nitrososphaeraceae archaeon]